MLLILLRGTTVNRTYGTHQNLYVYLFLRTKFGRSYFCRIPGNSTDNGPYKVVHLFSYAHGGSEKPLATESRDRFGFHVDTEMTLEVSSIVRSHPREILVDGKSKDRCRTPDDDDDTGVVLNFCPSFGYTQEG